MIVTSVVVVSVTTFLPLGRSSEASVSSWDTFSLGVYLYYFGSIDFSLFVGMVSLGPKCLTLSVLLSLTRVTILGLFFFPS